jgi:acylphosphatase
MVGEMLTLRLRITGRVQGVGYRDWIVAQARRLRVSGWVRNRADGSVEALVSGNRETVDAFLARAREGPPSARVVAIEETPDAPPAEPGFHRLPTR